MAGFAHVYLDRCKKESDSDDIIDIEVYKKLIQLDQRLGTHASEQLANCLLFTSRLDIIEVRFNDLKNSFNTILDDRLSQSQ